MEITLKLFTPFWPRCFTNPDRRCGEPDPEDPRGWHVGDMCDCPSCPLRCAIRDALTQYKKEV